MSRRLTVYLPDDVAVRLEREDNASAYLTAAARRAMRAEAVAEALAAAGYADLPVAVVDDQAAAFHADLEVRTDSALRARLDERLASYRARR